MPIVIVKTEQLNNYYTVAKRDTIYRKEESSRMFHRQVAQEQVARTRENEESEVYVQENRKGPKASLSMVATTT